LSELHKFLFDGLPVRGAIVRLTDAWQEILKRRAANNETGAYPAPVTELLGEMSAAAVLMQANIKFNGALVLQIFGDGPAKLAVVEVQPDFGVRATATLQGEVAPDASLSQMVNQNNEGRCAITLDPLDRMPGQQPYQGVVPLFGDQKEKLEKLSEVLEHYMLQSEQLDTTLVLAANMDVAAGILIQRLPLEGSGNLAGKYDSVEREAALGQSEDYNRISILAKSLKAEELLGLDIETVLHRLFWEEPLLRFEPLVGETGPKFHCSCSRERVGRMIKGLGVAEVESILSERENIEVGCEFCSDRPESLCTRLLDPPGSPHELLSARGTPCGPGRPPPRPLRLPQHRCAALPPPPQGFSDGPENGLSSTRPSSQPGCRVSAPGDRFWRRRTPRSTCEMEVGAMEARGSFCSDRPGSLCTRLLDPPGSPHA
jgi:molecular chaperone Hsp33